MAHQSPSRGTAAAATARMSWRWSLAVRLASLRAVRNSSRSRWRRSCSTSSSATRARSLGLEQEQLAGGHVAGAADRAGDVPVVVDRHHAAALQPVHAAVGPDHPVLDVVGRPVGDGPLEGGERRPGRRRDAAARPRPRTCRRTCRAPARTGAPAWRPTTVTPRGHVPPPRAEVAAHGAGRATRAHTVLPPGNGATPHSLATWPRRRGRARRSGRGRAAARGVRRRPSRSPTAGPRWP